MHLKWDYNRLPVQGVFSLEKCWRVFSSDRLYPKASQLCCQHSPFLWRHLFGFVFFAFCVAVGRVQRNCNPSHVIWVKDTETWRQSPHVHSGSRHRRHRCCGYIERHQWLGLFLRVCSSSVASPTSTGAITLKWPIERVRSLRLREFYYLLYCSRKGILIQSIAIH